MNENNLSFADFYWTGIKSRWLYFKSKFNLLKLTKLILQTQNQTLSAYKNSVKKST